MQRISYYSGCDVPMPWTVDYPFSDVTEHIKALDKPTAAKVDRMLRLLAQQGYRLPPEHTEALGDGLFELKIGGTTQRFFYGFSGKLNTIIVLLAMKKGGGARRGRRGQSSGIEKAKSRLSILRG